MYVKLPIIALIALLSQNSAAYSQDLAFINTSALSQKPNIYLNPTFPSDHFRHKHAVRTYVGGSLAITGAVVFVPTYLYSLATGGNANSTSTPKGEETRAILFAAGGAAIITGIILYCNGRKYEKKHPRKFAFTGSKDQIGIAYNF